jgi:hypothetical protein
MLVGCPGVVKCNVSMSQIKDSYGNKSRGNGQIGGPCGMADSPAYISEVRRESYNSLIRWGFPRSSLWFLGLTTCFIRPRAPR